MYETNSAGMLFFSIGLLNNFFSVTFPVSLSYFFSFFAALVRNRGLSPFTEMSF